MVVAQPILEIANRDKQNTSCTATTTTTTTSIDSAFTALPTREQYGTCFIRHPGSDVVRTSIIRIMAQSTLSFCSIVGCRLDIEELWTDTDY